MEDKSLPRYSGPVDHLRYGFRYLQTELAEVHPVAQIQMCGPEFQWRTQLQTVRKLHGSGFAMRLATERLVFNKPSRFPGLESSNILYDTITGHDTTISFEDYLGGE